MIAKQVLRSVLLVVVLGSVAIWANKEFQKSQAEPTAAAEETTMPAVQGDQVVMTYFISGGRCQNCRKIEALARETAEMDFKQALEDGRLVFRIIDVDEAGQGHYVDDYQLTAKTVVLSHLVDGKEAEWANMSKVWEYLGEPQAFHAYLADQIEKYLGS